MLAGCDIEEMTADQARRVGELAGRSDHEDVIDVAVVEGAARRDDVVILTSNESHIRKIIKATGKRIRIDTV
jgi:translation initiation factor IF-2